MTERKTGGGISWGTMLVLIVIAIAVAGLIAWQIVHPFFTGQR